MLRRAREIGVVGLLGLVACGSQTPAQTVPVVAQPVTVEATPVAPVVEPEATPVAARVVAADARERFIVPEAEAAKFFVGHHPKPSGYFTPGEDEVRAFEHDLPAFLAEATDPRARGIAAKLAGYRRQFIGVAGAEGRRVFGNYFCSDDPATQPVIVDDGGDCYFSVFYEPGGEAFTGLRIHGEG